MGIYLGPVRAAASPQGTETPKEKKWQQREGGADEERKRRFRPGRFGSWSTGKFGILGMEEKGFVVRLLGADWGFSYFTFLSEKW